MTTIFFNGRKLISKNHNVFDLNLPHYSDLEARREVKKEEVCKSFIFCCGYSVIYSPEVSDIQ